jgi:hypothetical protein
LEYRLWKQEKCIKTTTIIIYQSLQTIPNATLRASGRSIIVIELKYCCYYYCCCPFWDLEYWEEFIYSLRFNLKINLKKMLDAAYYLLLLSMQTTPLALATDA